MRSLKRCGVCSVYQIISLMTRLLIVLGNNAAPSCPRHFSRDKISASFFNFKVKAFFMLTNCTFLAAQTLFFLLLRAAEGGPVCAAASRIPSHVSAVCAQPCVHTRIASLCSESSPQIVQTSPSRLAGASAVTSPIHPSLDACQPGAARAVSMETSNKRARTPRSFHSPAWRAEP